VHTFPTVWLEARLRSWYQTTVNFDFQIAGSNNFADTVPADSDIMRSCSQLGIIVRQSDPT
jgi:hypothetical protein